MTQDEIIRMAREAGLGTALCHNSIDGDRIWIEGADWHDEVERFAALVAAHEREAFKVYVNQVVADREMAVHDAVLAEREACAKVCEEADIETYTFAMNVYEDATTTLSKCAAAIRAR